MMRVVLIGDMHVGSHWGVADYRETNKDSPGKEEQRKLYEAWCADIGGAHGNWKKPDALVLCGDVVDGQGKKDGGALQWTTDFRAQVNHAAHLIKMWEPKRIFVIGGSKYHISVGDTGYSAEEELAQRLKAEFYPNQDDVPEEDRRRCGPHWFLTFDKCTIHVAHRVSISRVFAYKSTPIAREMMQAKLNDPMVRKWEALYKSKLDERRTARGRSRKVITLEELESIDMESYVTRMVVRAHAHYWWSCDAGGTVGINLPCWQAPSPFIVERDPLGFSHIGFVGLKIEGTKAEYQCGRWRVEDVSPIPHTIVKP